MSSGRLIDSSAKLAKSSLLKFTGLISTVFFVTCAISIFFASGLDKSEYHKSELLARKAFELQKRSLLSTTKDYAFWGDAYRHLHLNVDYDWAYLRENLGPTLYGDFGINGVFVIGPSNKTTYTVIDGEYTAVAADHWVGSSIQSIVASARAHEDAEVPVIEFMMVDGTLLLVAAAAITPGTDPTVERDNGLASVLVFAQSFDEQRLTELGASFGISGLRLAKPDEKTPTRIALGSTVISGIVTWQPPTPGQNMLIFMLPLIGLAAILVYMMTWIILRRTTAAALTLDQSHASLKKSEAALAVSESRFRDIAEASSDWIWEIDSNGRFTYLSERFENITGYSTYSWLGNSIDQMLSGDDITITAWLEKRSRQARTSIQCTCFDKGGSSRILRVTARDMVNGGFRGTSTDITDDVEARKRIVYLSQHDVLTGLPNRVRLREFLDGKLKSYATTDRPLVMLSIDLDRFKPVNDLLGHAMGDRVLSEISRRLSDCIRGGDLVSRVGGDEFVMIATDISGNEEIESLCRRVISLVEQPVVLDGQDIFVSASIGIALAPSDASEAAELLRYSDIALYESKASGRGTWRFYAGDMNARIIERRRLESDLRYGIKNGELRLHFQPRFNISDGQMVGAEALVRWQHPDRGLISPDIFIPIAEETGLITPLSDWVLNTACEEATTWPEKLFVSVNLSSKEFQTEKLIERVKRTLDSSRLQPQRLELELTETVMLEDAESALALMQRLKSLGVRLAMDDFGTGYSSLSYLRSFPFDGLKIDKSFVSRLGDSENDRSIIQAIVGLGRALSLTVTAEGIESADHLELLKSVCCDEGQGYFLSRPLNSDDFDKILAAQYQLLGEGDHPLTTL